MLLALASIRCRRSGTVRADFVSRDPGIVAGVEKLNEHLHQQPGIGIPCHIGATRFVRRNDPTRTSTSAIIVRRHGV